MNDETDSGGSALAGNEIAGAVSGTNNADSVPEKGDLAPHPGQPSGTIGPNSDFKAPLPGNPPPVTPKSNILNFATPEKSGQAIHLPPSEPDAAGAILFVAVQEHEDDAYVDNEISEQIELIAHDIEDRDRRVVILIQRLNADQTAFALARELRSRAFIRKETAAIPVSMSLDELKASIAAALPLDSLAETMSAAFILSGPADETKSTLFELTSQKGTKDREELSKWLKQRNARLVISLSARAQLRPRNVANNHTGSYIVPWTRRWLFEFAKNKSGFTYHDLMAFSLQLEAIEQVNKPKDAFREENLFNFVMELDSKFGKSEVTFETLSESLQQAIDKAREPQNYEETARENLHMMFDPNQPVNISNSIVRILFAIVVLAGGAHEAAAFALTRALLPDGEAPDGLMSRIQRARWNREIETAVDLKQDKPPPASWVEVFDEDKDAFVRNAHLQLEVDPEMKALRFKAAGSLTYIDPCQWLLDKPAFLRELAARIKARKIAQTLEFNHLPVLTDFLAGLHALNPSLFSIEDFVTAYTGSSNTSLEFSVERQVAAGALPEHFTGLSDQIRFTGDVVCFVREPGVRHVVAHSSAEPDEQDIRQAIRNAEMAALDADEKLRILGAGDILHLLLPTARKTRKPADFMTQFAGRFTQRFAPRNIWIIFAYLVLYVKEPRFDENILGTWTLKPFDNTPPDQFWSLLTNLENALKSMIGGAVEDTRDLTAPFDYWADAVWIAAQNPQYAAFGEAIAVMIDDLMTSHEIPWHARALDAAPGAPPVLARKFFGQRPERSGDGLLERLFKRDARRYLGLIDTIDKHTAQSHWVADPSVERPRRKYYAERMERLLTDVFWVLIDEIDESEAAKSGMDRMTLEAIVWRAITQSFRFPSCSTTIECRTLVAESAEPEALTCDGLRLLDLYAPAVLLAWRFRALPAAPMRSGSQEELGFRACLDSLQDAAKNRYGAIHRALRALEDAEKQLTRHFKYQDCKRTQARHEVRTRIIAGIGRLFAPQSVSKI